MNFLYNSVKTLSPACLTNIGVKLSGPIGENYKDLAGRLGFTKDEVDKFVVQDSANPGLILLETWSQRANTTIKVLYYHLEHMKRHDILDILNKEKEGMYSLLGARAVK